MMLFTVLSCLLTLATATTIIYDGRAPLSYTAADLDSSADPYLSVVKGSKSASQYTTLLGTTVPPTPLWSNVVSEQVLSVTIDNSSVFVPGQGPPQEGFRRTELIAQANKSSTALDAVMEAGTSVFHFSVQLDQARPLNFTHEYQIVFIEPADGTHNFELRIGSPFTNPTGPLPASNAQSLTLLDHGLNTLFSTPIVAGAWQNFAVQVDWNNLTLAVLYSQDCADLQAVTPVVPNSKVSSGSAGQGDFHFGLLKLPLVNPLDSTANQSDVAHHGIQEGSTEGLLYSGVFVEQASTGISVGNGKTISQIQ